MVRKRTNSVQKCFLPLQGAADAKKEKFEWMIYV